MDFSTIKLNLDENYYEGLAEFNADVHLVFDNCEYYNGTDHEITKMAMAIKK